MKLSTLLPQQHILKGLQAKSIAGAVPEMLHHVGNLNLNLPIEEVAQQVLQREALSSTALELGIAAPHARIPELRDFYIFLGLPEAPLEDRGHDGQPVDVVFLIISNDKKNTLMLQSLAAVGVAGQNPELMDRIHTGAGSEDIWQALDDSGVQVKKTLHAGDLMRTDFVRVRPSETLKAVIDALYGANAREVVVLNDKGKALGVITPEEIIEAGFPDYMARMDSVAFLADFEPFEQFFKRETETLAKDLMNKDFLAVDETDPIIQVVFRLKQDHQQVALVTHEGACAGVIDRNDIITRILRA